MFLKYWLNVYFKLSQYLNNEKIKTVVVEERNYFGYQIPGAATFIGNKKNEVINTMNYYRKRGDQEHFDIPSKEKIMDLKLPIHITCCFPLAKVDHNIDVEARPGFFFDVDANAWNYMQQISRNYEEKLKRGDLYKFVAGAPIFGLWFLPEYVMSGLREYDWEKDREKIDLFMDDREKIIRS